MISEMFDVVQLPHEMKNSSKRNQKVSHPCSQSFPLCAWLETLCLDTCAQSNLVHSVECLVTAEQKRSTLWRCRINLVPTGFSTEIWGYSVDSRSSFDSQAPLDKLKTDKTNYIVYARYFLIAWWDLYLNVIKKSKKMDIVIFHHVLAI